MILNPHAQERHTLRSDVFPNHIPTGRGRSRLNSHGPIRPSVDGSGQRRNGKAGRWLTSASREKESHERKKKKRDMSKNATQKRQKMRPKPRWQQGWMAGSPADKQTTRKEFSGKKITFPCLLFSRRVDDVPPKAEAVKGWMHNSMSQPKPRNKTHPTSSRRRERAAMLNC